MTSAGFHLLNAPADWTDPEGVVWDAERQGLTLQPLWRGTRRPAPALDDVLRGRRGACCDAEGTWYWVGADGSSIARLAAGSTADRFWPRPRLAPPTGAAPVPFHLVTPTESPRLCGLTLTPGGRLVAGVVAPVPGLLVFDLLTAAPPLPLRWHDGFTPLALCAATDGGVWAVDRRQGLRHVPLPCWGSGRAPTGPTSDFHPGGPAGQSNEQPPPSPSPPSVGRLPTGDALAAAALPDGSVLVLVVPPGGPAAVVRRRQDRPGGEVEVVLTAEGPDAEPVVVEPRVYDMAWVPGASEGGAAPLRGTLFFAALDWWECLSFDLEADLEGAVRLSPRHDHLPLPRADGGGLAAGPAGARYHTPDGWLPIAAVDRPAHVRQGRARTSLMLDGVEHGAAWHRILLDAIVPPGTSVGLETRCADHWPGCDEQAWEAVPTPYLRAWGAELPWFQPFAAEEAGAQAAAGTWEALVQRATGRYLQVRLTLRGDGGDSPVIRAVRVHHPRATPLIERLPEAYRTDRDSADFLERFLANVDGMHADLEERMLAARLLWDPRAAPADRLPWLSGWFAHILDAHWDISRCRLFLEHAPDLFAARGTAPALVRLIRLAAEANPTEAVFREGVGPYLGLAEAGPGVHFHIAEGFAGAPDAVPAAGGEGRAHAPLFRADTMPTEMAGRQEERLYRTLLRNRYGQIDRMRAAYGLEGATPPHSFDEVVLPGAEPARDPARRDWLDFQARYLPRLRGAHRFTVFVHEGLDGHPRLDLDALRRLLAWERPAHTVAEIRLVSGQMRVGVSSPGLLALLGRSAPREPLGAVLGRAHLGRLHLGQPKPRRRGVVVGALQLAGPGPSTGNGPQ